MERRFTALLRERKQLSTLSLALRTAATWMRHPTTNTSAIKFCYLRGMSVRQLEPLADYCLKERILPDLYDGVRAAIEEVRRLEMAQLLVTGGPSFLARPLGSRLGVADVIDCTPRVHNGRYTGLLDGLHPRGEDKIRTVREFLAHHGYAWEDCAALADHELDIPLLRQVGRPIVCNPTPALGRTARSAGWPILTQPYRTDELVKLLTD